MKTEVCGFGMPAGAGRFFCVEIPRQRREDVKVLECFGEAFEPPQGRHEECRAAFGRHAWSAVKDHVRNAFNRRLKARKLPAGTWRAGRTGLDRMLGRELCVLAWALEFAAPGEIEEICRAWLRLRPEELWWLYAKSAADSRSGWRPALYCMLSKDAAGVGTAA